eukprot:5491771-Prymnesium_polylepis.1
MVMSHDTKPACNTNSNTKSLFEFFGAETAETRDRDARRRRWIGCRSGGSESGDRCVQAPALPRLVARPALRPRASSSFKLFELGHLQASSQLHRQAGPCRHCPSRIAGPRGSRGRGRGGTVGRGGRGARGGGR